MEITGKLIKAMPEQSGISQKTGNPWKSREYVIEYGDGQYPKHCLFRVFGEERLKSFDLHFGDVVTLSVEINAHEYNGRWYNEISAYKVVKQGQQTAQPQAVPPQAKPVVQAQTSSLSEQTEENPNDLPF
jgi:hypothetical protein